MFEYIEAEIEEKVVQGLYESKVGFTWMDENSSSSQDKINSVGYEGVKMIGLTKRYFL